MISQKPEAGTSVPLVFLHTLTSHSMLALTLGGYELGLLPEKVEGIRTENVLTYWAVEDITDAYDKMVSHGAKELETPNDVGEGIKVALVKDPWLNVIGLIYNPFFKQKSS